MKKECIYALECDFQPGDDKCDGCDYWQEDLTGYTVSDPFGLLDDLGVQNENAQVGSCQWV